MYFIDRGKIKKAITYMDALIELYEENGEWDSLKDRLALERLSLGAIEAIIDVGNSMIDGFIMRDPGSYEDIIDILVDEKVITREMDQPLKEVVGLRKMLVRDFIEVDHEEIKRVMDAHLTALKQFGPKVGHYLEYELGPVSAFIPENGNEQN
ncbi:MAG: type VII toxin-antitoxin system HepT family RNase toxin [Bacillota bacterium]